ncbi:MAG: hypothetical protein JST89_13255 [Cyanobacteria bacterium SZAS-4]|nr:hypothetical protein [Cyanobacteria bacterium SZAS-4]
MRRRIRLTAMALTYLALIGSSVSAQNWRPDNPDQPNGYHASEAASHYHGNLHMPAQQQNGYRASEARSHYGGERCEPSSGWNYENNSGPGSAFNNDSNSGGGIGSAYSNVSAYSNASRFQNGGPENSYSERMCRANRWQAGYRNLAAAGYIPGQTGSTGGGAQPATGFQSFRSRYETYSPLIERESAWRQRAIENVEDGQGGFTHIYAN